MEGRRGRRKGLSGEPEGMITSCWLTPTESWCVEGRCGREERKGGRPGDLMRGKFFAANTYRELVRWGCTGRGRKGRQWQGRGKA